MPLSRRRLLELGSITAGISAATSLLDLPAFAVPEPVRGVRLTRDILLNSNENPYGAFPSAHKAMVEAVSVSNRYPDYEFDALWDSLAKLHGCKTEEITLGCGSTDILRMAAVA